MQNYIEISEYHVSAKLLHKLQVTFKDEIRRKGTNYNAFKEIINSSVIITGNNSIYVFRPVINCLEYKVEVKLKIIKFRVNFTTVSNFYDISNIFSCQNLKKIGTAFWQLKSTNK